MINKIIEYALKQGFLVIVVICAIIGMGLYYTLRLPVDAVPDVTTNQVQINTEVQGLGPIEMEKLVPFPIESSMSGLPDVVETRSLSKSGLSQVTIVFDDRVNIYFARQLVLEWLQTAKVATQVLEEQMRFDLVVRFSQEARSCIEEIKNILVSAPGGVCFSSILTLFVIPALYLWFPKKIRVA